MKLLHHQNKIIRYDGEIEIKDKFENTYIHNISSIDGEIIIEKTPLFQLPPEIFDIEVSFRQRVLNTFKETSEKTIGVFLRGSKGQGKSLLAMQLALESGLPIFSINSSLGQGTPLKEYLNSIKQEIVLLVDEFEKIVPDTRLKDDINVLSQEYFLSLLSGTTMGNHKKLVIFTSNDKINDLFMNRPARIRYYRNFEFIPQELIDIVLTKKLKYPEFREDLLNNIDLMTCNLDILLNIIEEINLYKKPFSEWKHWFNYRPIKIEYNHEIWIDNNWKHIEMIESNRDIFSMDTVSDLKNILYSSQIIPDYNIRNCITNLSMTPKYVLFSAPYTDLPSLHELMEEYNKDEDIANLTQFLTRENKQFFKHKITKL